MKLFKFHGTIVLILGLLLCPIVLSDKYPQITIFVTIGVQADSPLQIIGFKRATSPKLVLHNVSSKQIERFLVYGLRGNTHVEENSNATGTENSALGAVASNYQEGTVTIPPDGFADVPVAGFQPLNLAGSADPPVNLHSNCIHVAAAVVSVEFEDGTSWVMSQHWNDKQNGNEIWRKSISSESLNSCRNSPGSEEALSQIHGTTFEKPGPETNADEATVQQYSLKCSVVTRKEKPAISCPWK